jgi:serine/threonine-protein kinase
VLLSGGTAMVTDFGIAKALTASRAQDGGGDARATSSGTLTSAGSSIGTPAYMAPEQAVGSAVDLRADLYAWGVMAYELLTGAHPFANRTTAQQLIAAHIAEVPAPIASKKDTIPSALVAVVMRCLAKDPGERPQSAAEVLAALDNVSTPDAAASASRTPAATLSPTPPNKSSRVWMIAAATAVLVGGGAWAVTHRGASPPSATATAEKSLAVLPFSSVGGDTANAYFAEGIADELTTALARLPGLRLAGRSSAARYKQQNAGAQEIGKALGVAAVLDGTVRRAGDRIRVAAELTNAADGRLIWRDSYEREAKDVFAVQDDITRAIVGALQVRLADGASASPPNASQGTTNLEAYDLYLRGLQGYRKRGRDLLQAERNLEQAIALDSGFARAYATLASVLMVKPYYFDVSMATTLPRARAAAERAVALDDRLAEAHLASGHVHTEAFEWKEADAELRRAMMLDPNRAEIPFRLGFMLLTSGRVHESIAAFEQAKTVDPFYSMPSIYLAWSLALAGRNAEAIAEARRALDLDPTNEAIGNIYGRVLSMAGKRDEAVAFSRARVAVTTNTRRLAFHASVLAASGAVDDARAILRRIEAMPSGAWGRNSSLLYLYLALGDTTRALDALERAAAADGDLVLAQAISLPLFDQIRSSARFAAAMRRFNLDLARVTAADGGRSQ